MNRSNIRVVTSRLPSAGLRHVVFGACALMLAIGCTGSPVGDPCIPESIPEGGFDAQEVYLETSSVQCRTRTCMVYNLQGNPERIAGEPSCPMGAADCVTRPQLASQVFCSCRCSVEEGQAANAPLCNCGQGFTCEDGLVSTGGEGVTGGYCVPCRFEGDDRQLDSATFGMCPEA